MKNILKKNHGLIETIINNKNLNCKEMVLMLVLLENLKPFYGRFACDKSFVELGAKISVGEDTIKKFLKSLSDENYIRITAIGPYKNLIFITEMIEQMCDFENYISFKRDLECLKNNELTSKERIIIAKILNMTPKQQELTEFYIDTMIKNI